MGGWPHFHREYESVPDFYTWAENEIHKIELDKKESHHRQVRLAQTEKIDKSVRYENLYEAYHQTRLTEEQTDGAIKDYVSGMALEAVCKKHGCPRVTFTRYLKKRGILVRTASQTMKMGRKTP